jgi:hypothetical protein
MTRDIYNARSFAQGAAYALTMADSGIDRTFYLDEAAAALREATELVERARKPDFFAVACAITQSDRRAA